MKFNKTVSKEKSVLNRSRMYKERDDISETPCIHR